MHVHACVRVCLLVRMLWMLRRNLAQSHLHPCSEYTHPLLFTLYSFIHSSSLVVASADFCELYSALFSYDMF